MKLFYRYLHDNEFFEQYVSKPVSIESMWHYINYTASIEDLIDKENDFSMTFSENQISIYPVKNKKVNNITYFVLRNFTIKDLQDLRRYECGK